MISSCALQFQPDKEIIAFVHKIRHMRAANDTPASYAFADASVSSAYRSLINGSAGLSDMYDGMDRPICKPAHLKLQPDFEMGQWYAHPITKHLFWEPQGCRLRRLTAFEARQCLSGRHLGFVGDSVSR